MSGAEKQSRETSALLASYAAGAATDAERAEVEARVKEDADAAARLALARSTREAIRRSEAEAQEGWSPGELGFRRLLRDIEREAPASPRAAWTESLALWRGVAAAAVIALVVVSAWPSHEEGALPGGGGAGPGYGTATDPSDAAAVAQIAFQPTATEAEIRGLLAENRARLVDGPSALGIYRIQFESVEARDAAMERMRASGIVESVNPE